MRTKSLGLTFRRRRAVLAASCVVALLASACGGGSTSSTTSQTSTTALGSSTSAPEATTTTVDDDAAVREFYEGKTITIVVGSAAGGGFDTWARLIARHMPKHIPGEPNVIVENMPGGGNMVAQNYMYNLAAKDGTVIGNASASVTIRQLFGDPAVEFDMRDFLYLGQPDVDGTSVLWAHEDWEGTFEDLMRPDGPELIIGASAPGSLQYDPAVLLGTVLGANVRIVGGYPGSGELRLALEQGEIDAFFLNWETAHTVARDEVTSGHWRPLIKYGERDEGHPDTGHIPSVYEFVDSQDQRDMLYYGGTGGVRRVQQIYYLPPGTPEDRYQALKRAFEAALSDPALLAEAETAGQVVSPLTGEQVSEMLADFLNLPSETVDALREALQFGES